MSSATRMRTSDELVKIYTDTQQGRSPREIAQTLGVSTANVTSALAILKTYLSGKSRSKQRSSYVVAALQIRKQRTFTRSQPSTSIPPSGSVVSLKASFDAFQQAIATYIETEIKSRHKALQDEIEALREENTQLKQEARQGQSINWIDTLEDTLAKEDA